MGALTEKQLDYHRKYREDNREKTREAALRHYYKHRDKILKRNRAARKLDSEETKEKRRANARKWSKANPDKVRNKGLKTKYGITLDQWNTMFEAQGRVCGVCRKDKPGRKHWATDHCHETGRVRGVLCHRCNLMLGEFGDNADGVKRRFSEFLEYLK